MAKTSVEQGFTIGREGLMVPVLKVLSPQGHPDVLGFFRELRDLNGIGKVADSSEYEPRLILPPTAGQPLVIIKGLYEATAEKRNPHLPIPTTVGYERHAIETPPKTKSTKCGVPGFRSAGQNSKASVGGQPVRTISHSAINHSLRSALDPGKQNVMNLRPWLITWPFK